MPGRGEGVLRTTHCAWERYCSASWNWPAPEQGTVEVQEAKVRTSVVCRQELKVCVNVSEDDWCGMGGVREALQSPLESAWAVLCAQYTSHMQQTG